MTEERASYTTRAVCRICFQPLPSPFLSLGLQPPANNLYGTAASSLSAPRFPLNLVRCAHCTLTQLSVAVDPHTLFDTYLYTPDQSKTFREHFSLMAYGLTKSLSLDPGDLVVDLGSNSGLLLSFFQPLGLRVVGVDPAENLAKQANERGIPTICSYWDEETARAIESSSHQKARLITATNVFAHVDNLHLFLRAVTSLLAPDGTLVIEVPSLPIMLRDGTWDLIYSEHLSYIDPYPLLYLFKAHALSLYRVEDIPIHGGSFRLFVKHLRDPRSKEPRALPPSPLPPDLFSTFASRASSTRDTLVSLIRGLRQEGKKVVGYGAPAKATVLISYAGLGREEIAYVVDDSPLKQGKYVPGTDIPIVGGERLEQEPAEVAVVFPWNISEEILGKLQGKVGRAIIPMPDARVVDI